jgi:DNA-binding MarR family transcriptional regulator
VNARTDRLPVRGPRFAAVARMRLNGQKRHRVLALVAAYLDAGIDDPSIAELAARARLGRYVVVQLVDKLEADGFITIERGCREARERNRYRLLGEDGEP